MTAHPLKVVHFTSSSERGGAEEHLAALVRRLDRSQFAPAVVCRPTLAKAMEGSLGDGAKLVPVDLWGPRDFRAVPRLVKLFHRLNADIVHSHLFCSSLLASPAARLASARVVIETPHVAEDWRRGWRANFLADRIAARAVDAFIAVSQANARYLIEKKGLPQKKVHVICNGVDFARFEGGARESLRIDLGIAAGDPVAVCIARLEPQKGHHILLEAMSCVRREIPAIKLILVGEGSLRSPLEQQALALGLSKCVRFVGWQTSVADWLAMADVVVLASLYEGLPLVILEALAARRPVVATAVDGTPEVIHHERTGLTVPPGDRQALAHAILRILRDRNLARHLAAAGRDLIESRFSHNNQVRQTEQLYREMWERRRGYRMNPAIARNPKEVSEPWAS